MTVACPRCAARYALPDRLVGPAGARARCPRCGERFLVAGPRAAAPDAAAAVEALARRCGPSLPQAAGEDRLFATHGAEVCGAFEAFTAAGGDPAAFRTALSRQLGVRLPG